MKLYIPICCILLLVIPLVLPAFGQDYKELMQQNKYADAVVIIESRLSDIYKTRVYDKRIPTPYIAIEKLEAGIDLQKLFSERKADPFFIENNEILYTLHYHAAQCYHKIFTYNYALQHYIQALRFTTITDKDHVIFYSMSQIFKSLNKFDAYLQSLEEAYELKPDNYDYSLELAHSLSSGKNLRKALYHLNRYIQLKGGDIPPDVYLTAANLYESIGDFINASRFYRLYLGRNPNDYNILFALGYLSYTKISDMKTAYDSFSKAIPLLNVDDNVRRGQAYSMLGDIDYMDRKYSESIAHYHKSIESAEIMKSSIENKRNLISAIKNDINAVKASLLEKKEAPLYTEYQTLADELGINELRLRELEHEYSKLNTGNVYFKIASAYEAHEQYSQAIDWYSKAIAHGTNIRLSAKKIERLRLKLSRGY